MPTVVSMSLHSFGQMMTESHTFGATAHDDAHDALITLPAYAIPSAGRVIWVVNRNPTGWTWE